MSLEVQNRGISGPTKRNHVLQKFKKKKKNQRITVSDRALQDKSKEMIFDPFSSIYPQNAKLCFKHKLKTKHNAHTNVTTNQNIHPHNPIRNWYYLQNVLKTWPGALIYVGKKNISFLKRVSLTFPVYFSTLQILVFPRRMLSEDLCQ